MELTAELVVLALIGGAILAVMWRDELDGRTILTLVKWLGIAILALLIVILWFVTLPWSLFGTLGVLVGQESGRKKANETPHEHPGAGWHVHSYDGKIHFHPQGMNGPWVEATKEH